jgi:hypothetical protein
VTTTLQLEAASFGIDPEDTRDVFAGWHDPRQRWNGWATPRFDRAEVERIIEWVARTDRSEDAPRFRWDGEVLVQDDPPYQDDPGYEPTRYEADEAGRYSVGSWSWTWSEVDLAEVPPPPA